MNFKIGEDEDSTLEDIVYNEDQETVEEIVYKKLFVLAEGDAKNRTDVSYLATIPLL